MRAPEADHGQMKMRREKMLSTAYRLFSEKGITAVRLTDIAEEAGCGKRTLLHYFDSKAGLVMAVTVWKWTAYFEENRKRRPKVDFEGLSFIWILFWNCIGGTRIFFALTSCLMYIYGRKSLMTDQCSHMRM